MEWMGNAFEKRKIRYSLDYYEKKVYCASVRYFLRLYFLYLWGT
jgi:hypothetical protein